MLRICIMYFIGFFIFWNRLPIELMQSTINPSNCLVRTKIRDYFLQQVKSKINELPDQMQKALRNLTEETVEELIIIDRLPYPDKSCTYELRAIFASEDANALFDAICKLSNKSRNAFIA